MKRKHYSEEKIISILQEAESGMPVTELLRKHNIANATFYRWKDKYGGMTASEAKRLRALEEENRKLKRLVADLSLDKLMLEDVVQKKW